MRVIFLPETDHVSLVASNAVHFPPWAVAGQKLLNLETKKEHFDEEREGWNVFQIRSPNYIYHLFYHSRI